MKKRPWLWLLVAIVFVDVIGVIWWHHTSRERRFDRQIVRAAQEYGVEPALVKAVIWKESRFQDAARGAAGEIGLMQLRAAAAGEWATARQVDGFEHEHVLDPATNILAGTWYLAKVTRRYIQTDNPFVYGLADYNAGRTHVLRWMEGPARTNSAAFLERMDYPSTRQYIHNVLEQRERYRKRFAY